MLLDLREMSSGRTHVERTYAARDFAAGHEEYAVRDDVTLTLDIDQNEDQYHVSRSPGHVGRFIVQPVPGAVQRSD